MTREHLGCGGLLFQRLARLGDQPRVLHRDHRLRREVLRQRDLPFSKGPYLACRAMIKAPKGASSFTQSDEHERAHASEFDHAAIAAGSSGQIQIRRRNIENLNNPLSTPSSRDIG